MRKTFLAFVLLLFCGILFSQQKTHNVQAKETVYGISKQYGISQEELINANPFLNERSLQIGDELIIPGVNTTPVSDGSIKTAHSEPVDVYIPKEDTNFIYIKIQPKQTVYSLAKEYNISEEALESLNPQLKHGLKAGDVIRLPKKTQTSESEATPSGMYRVKRGDTVYSLSKQFDVTEDEFYIANPLVQMIGLKVDTYINIPKKGKSNAVIQDGFIEHTVKQGETIYSITKLYKVSFTDLLKENPSLSEGLKEGMVLRIPLAEGANIQKFGKIKRLIDDEVNIALLLPFHLSDDSKKAEKAISTDFLIGSKIALESFVKKGKKINLTVLDSENSASSVESLVLEGNFSKFDAVVGPLFGSTFKSFAQMLNGSGIAVVAPLSNSDDLKELENVILATPSDESIADAIVSEVKLNYKGQIIQILTDDRHDKLTQYFVNQLKEKISGAEVVTVKDANQLVQKSETVNETLTDGTIVKKEYFTPIITVLVSDDNTLGNAYVKKIREMNAENLTAFGIKFVSAYDIYNSKNKSNIAALKNIGFTFGTIHLINVYGKEERKTLERFMDTYCLTPNEYQQIGYDIMYDLVDRMNSQGDILNSLSAEKTRLSTKFNYEKEGKAYVNKAVRVIRLFEKPSESPEETEEIND
ncbi:MAG: LysM peptidoglycan-binding domain-containing protein [Moheibacter sp.]